MRRSTNNFDISTRDMETIEQEQTEKTEVPLLPLTSLWAQSMAAAITSWQGKTTDKPESLCRRGDPPPGGWSFPRFGRKAVA